mgnify:CR=1 FL=1
MVFFQTALLLGYLFSVDTVGDSLRHDLPEKMVVIHQFTDDMVERLAEMGRCLSPCDLSVTPADYSELVERVRLGLAPGRAALAGRSGRCRRWHYASRRLRNPAQACPG